MLREIRLMMEKNRILKKTGPDYLHTADKRDTELMADGAAKAGILVILSGKQRAFQHVGRDAGG